MSSSSRSCCTIPRVLPWLILALTCALTPSSAQREAMSVRFVDLVDGATVQATLNAKGRPQVPITLEVVGAGAIGVSLSANGLAAGFVENAAGVDPFRAFLVWSPALGAGTYTLEAFTMTADKSQLATAQIQVTVTGVPAIAPPPAPQGLATAKARIIALYQETFGIRLTSPALARRDRSGVPNDPWVSVAYIADRLYQINLYPDGHSEAYLTPIGHEIETDRKVTGKPVCWPAGTYSLLVVFLDWGNLGVTREEALAALEQATTGVNAAYAASATQAGLSQPIFALRTTGVVVSPVPDIPGHLLARSQVQSLTGLDLMLFDFVTQVDLDRENTARRAFAQPNWDTFGFASGTCGPAQEDVHIWVCLDEKSQLYGPDGRLESTLLSHEVFHLLGYPASHDWPCTDGSVVDQSDCCGGMNVPALLFGWTDTDGDGLVEILDPTPYGLVLP